MSRHPEAGATTQERAPVPYLVMELLDGQNLADRLRGGPLPWPDAVRVCADVAAALSAAHSLGVAHRDIKPGNVTLTLAGAKVVDFGIAATARGRDPAPRAGTPAYLAPEVLHGRGSVRCVLTRRVAARGADRLGADPRDDVGRGGTGSPTWTRAGATYAAGTAR